MLQTHVGLTLQPPELGAHLFECGGDVGATDIKATTVSFGAHVYECTVGAAGPVGAAGSVGALYVKALHWGSVCMGVLAPWEPLQSPLGVVCMCTGSVGATHIKATAVTVTACLEARLFCSYSIGAPVCNLMPFNWRGLGRKGA